jgi:hypothetical protein
LAVFVQCWTNILKGYVMNVFARSAVAVIFAALLFGISTSAAEMVDRVVAISAGSAVTWSGALIDANCQAFLAREPPLQIGLNDPGSIEKLRSSIERLADQLILEKVRQRSPLAGDPATEAEGGSTAAWDAIVGTYPSPEDLVKAMAGYGVDADILRSRLAREQRIMTFVDYSLRPQIRVESAQLSAYYENEFLPQFKKEQPSRDPPPLDDVRFQIEEILVQRGINEQMGPWLDNLKKEQGTQSRLIRSKVSE